MSELTVVDMKSRAPPGVGIAQPQRTRPAAVKPLHMEEHTRRGRLYGLKQPRTLIRVP